METWNDRPLEKQYPFVVGALVINVRRDGAVRSTSGLIAMGISSEGHREVLGLEIGDSESAGTWAGSFERLKKRGSSGVELITSDNHRGLVGAAKKHFQGAMWQRCQVHFTRNVLGHTPRHLKEEMAVWLRRIFRSETKAEARRVFAQLTEKLGGKADKALDVLGGRS